MVTLEQAGEEVLERFHCQSLKKKESEELVVGFCILALVPRCWEIRKKHGLMVIKGALIFLGTKTSQKLS